MDSHHTHNTCITLDGKIHMWTSIKQNKILPQIPLKQHTNYLQHDPGFLKEKKRIL